MKKFDVVALGELLIDFTENGLSGQGNTLFEANPGGAPCNVLAMLKKLDRDCAFVGKVGDDMFGQLLRKVAEDAGICMDYLVADKDVRTTLAFVKKLENGDRDFSFYRNPGADMMLTENEIPEEAISNCRIFHFGTLSMTHEGVRKATCKAIDIAKKGGALLSRRRSPGGWHPDHGSGRSAPDRPLPPFPRRVLLPHCRWNTGSQTDGCSPAPP